MTDKQPDDVLKPCPFCGGDDVQVTFPPEPFGVECFNCYTSGPQSDSKPEAITAWNTRSAPPDHVASHAIITKLIGYAGHDFSCPVHAHYDDCTCGYSEAVKEAREFMGGGDE